MAPTLTLKQICISDISDTDPSYLTRYTETYNMLYGPKANN
jgi:hypothetical protein